ncbi:MAG: SUMF1/EgtB/PvdO family nonheme iron enzyme [Hyphomicrobiaceae bacterium]
MIILAALLSRLFRAALVAAALGLTLFAARPDAAHAQRSCPSADPAVRRVALVIGIEDYTYIRRLNNPVRDATAIADLLCKHGIQPTLLKNPTHAELLIAVDAFESDASGADLALVYYAGHGMNLEGEDVLLPKDLPQRCEPKTAAEAQRGTIRVERLVAAMRGAKNRIALFDACRTTTFPNCPGRGDETATFRGLGRIAEQGALIATSTSRGSVAADGVAGRNSPYAELLLRQLAARPGSYFHDVLIEVNRELITTKPDGQLPELVLPRGGVPPRACLAATGCGVAAPVAAADTSEMDRLRAEVERLRRERQAALAASQAAAAPAQPPRPTAPADAVAALVPGSGKSARDCLECPEMVVAPAGPFTMGSSEAEIAALTKEFPAAAEYFKWEGPQRKVVIPQPFAVGRFAITRGEFAAFVAATGHKTDGGCYTWAGTEWKLQADKSWRSVGFEQTDRHPVVCVNWHDAQAYVKWLSAKTGHTYRLLSEAEREYAARAGTTTSFWWGNSISTSQANYDGNYSFAGSAKGEYRRKTVPVDSFQPNPWGLYQVHGNVYDWVEDCWHDSYNGAPTDGSAWITTCADGNLRVLRGGSWISDPRNLRSADRYRVRPVSRNYGIGFRVGRFVSR